MNCRPHDPQTGCACALICARCRACFVHCQCPPETHRAKDPDKLLKMLRHLAATRRIGGRQ